MKTMRRKDRELEKNVAIKLLLNCEYGVLSTVGESNQPYGVPLSYAYINNCIYVHSALAGHKIENLELNPKVSFCVVGSTKVIPDKFTTDYESVIVFGTALEVTGSERLNALMILLEKYSPQHISAGKTEIKNNDKATKVIKIEIEHITGKSNR